MMRRDTAHALINLLCRHAGEQDALLKSVQQTEPPTEFERIRAMLARTMGAIYLEAVNPILLEHPDLKPPHLR